MNKDEIKNHLNIAINVSKQVGEYQKRFFAKNLHVIRKSKKELVSEVDIESQNISFSLLSKETEFDMLSEENLNYDIKSDYFWVIDPLDGSHNYIAKQSNYGISIALIDNKKKEILLGVIHLSHFGKIYYSSKFENSKLNEKDISVSNNNVLEKSMIMYDNNFQDKNVLSNFINILKSCFTIRITGSAIYDCVNIASGLIDGRIWNNTKVYDVAAGISIIEKSGGIVTDLEGNKINLKSLFSDGNNNSIKMVASNGKIHDQIIETINQR